MNDIKLRPMTDAEYTIWRVHSPQGYAEDLVMYENVASLSEAQKLSEADYQKLLPQGKDTPNHYFYTIILDEQAIGNLWLSMKQDHSVICDFEIVPKQRLKGYAQSSLRRLEDEIIALNGPKTIRLHVFTNNYTARRVYEKLGYEYEVMPDSQETSRNMKKEIK